MTPSRRQTSRSSSPESSDSDAAASTGGARRRVWLFRFVAILLSLLLILLVAEVVLRAIDYRPASTNSLRKLRRTDDPHLLYDCFPENRNGEFDPLPDTEEGPWELLTNTGEPLPWSRLQETPWCVEYRLSKLKLRENELPGYWPPEGKTRIACVGDSFVYGQGVRI